MGSPAGRKTRWGKAAAPEWRGLPGMKWRVSTSQAEAAAAATEGQHESSGGVAAVVEGQHEWGGGCGRRNDEPARRKQRPFPPRGGKTTV